MATPTITGDYLMRQYLGFTTQQDILNGATPLGGLGRNWLIQSVATGGASITLLPTQIGSTCLFDAASGGTFTLPAPATIPYGSWFEFVQTVTITSNSAKVITDASTTYLLGGMGAYNPAGTGALYVANGSTIRSVNGNGTTTGGIAGARFRVSLINATQWFVEGFAFCTGTTATPFATS